MKLSRVLSLAVAAALLTGSIAEAQPIGTLYTLQAQERTYAAAKVGLSPAASATDFFTITGLANKRIRVRRMSCNGTSTAAATAVIQVVKRSTANTSGTSTAITAVPYNSGPGLAASGTVLAYTVNPTTGTLVGAIASGELTTAPLATPAVTAPTLVFDFSNQQVYLNSASEVLALNGNGASFTSGASLNCTVEWSEG